MLMAGLRAWRAAFALPSALLVHGSSGYRWSDNGDYGLCWLVLYCNNSIVLKHYISITNELQVEPEGIALCKLNLHCAVV